MRRQEIAAVWDVSLKTARRDIAALKAAISYICWITEERGGIARRLDSRNASSWMP